MSFNIFSISKDLNPARFHSSASLIQIQTGEIQKVTSVYIIQQKHSILRADITYSGPHPV